MKSKSNEPSRWTQTNFPPGVDRTLADMLRAARDLPVPDHAAAKQTSLGVRGRSGTSIGSVRWSLAVLALLLFIGTAGVVAGTQVFRSHERPITSPEPVPPAAEHEGPASAPKATQALPSLTPRPEIAQAQEQAARALPQNARKSAKAGRRIRPGLQNPLQPPSPNAGFGDGRALSEIYRLLRANKTPELALQRLDDFAERFPASPLHSEAQLARVEALMAVRNYGEASRALEHVNPGSTNLRRMVQVTRGELLVKQHACEQAVVEFDSVIAENRQDVFDERALYGRASCRLVAGDVDRARSDLARYLERHPNGVRAANIKKQLEASL